MYIFTVHWSSGDHPAPWSTTLDARLDMPITSSIYFENISQLIFESLNLLVRVRLLSQRLGIPSNSILEHVGNVRYRPCGSLHTGLLAQYETSSIFLGSTYAEVESTFLLEVGLDNVAHRLPHTVLNVDFLRLISRECPTQ